MYNCVIGGILRPVAQLLCCVRCCLLLFDSGGADNFVTYNSVPSAVKIDLFFVCGTPRALLWKKIKIIY